MAGNKKLTEAARAKNDEFYTQFDDIQKELNHYYLYNKDFLRDKTVLLPCDDPEWSMFTEFFIQNFDTYGLKKLISTSYAVNSKKIKYPVQPTLWEATSPHFDPQITDSRGKIFTLTREDFDDSAQYPKNLKWRYLEGDGDFRSPEVKKLRDEADVIITNPPFSLFREFLAWIIEADKKFLIIGNQNVITYKEVFPLIKENVIWLGPGFSHGNAYFSIPPEYRNDYVDGVYNPETGLVKFRNCRWFTNIDHAKRHEPLQLMTMAENLRHNKKLIKAGGYRRYDNYDAIDVPFTDAIPSDYFGDMGVPITYLDKHNPDQFEIVKFRKGNDDRDLTYTVEDNTISSDAGCRMPDAGCRMPDAGCRMPDAGCRMPDAGCRMPDAGCRMPDARCRMPESYAILQNPHSAESVAASWGCQSPSSTSIPQNSLKSSAARISTATAAITKPEPTGTELLAARVSTSGCLFAGRCSGVMGVPITFLDKYNPEQFEILGMAAGNSRACGFNYEVKYIPHEEDRGGCGVIENERVYARVLIRHRRGE